MKVLLVFGGEGGEHEVSIMSARNVAKAIQSAGYELQLAYITKDGSWLRVESIESLDSGEAISFDSVDVDVVFPLIHGIGGEDGTIAYMAKSAGIPVVGCGRDASMIAWDKDRCKMVLEEKGIPVVPWVTLRKDSQLSYKEAAQELDSVELFVKPAREGSSIGVGRATNAQEFAAACELAFLHDDKILVERAIQARELECAVLGNGLNVRVSALGEVETTSEFYDYDAKYLNQAASTIQIPANNLSNEQVAVMQGYARRAFAAIGGVGLSRIDFFLGTDGDMYLNEINTMPGFTNSSMYPQLWQHAGVSYEALITQLIDLATAVK